MSECALQSLQLRATPKNNSGYFFVFKKCDARRPTAFKTKGYSEMICKILPVPYPIIHPNGRAKSIQYPLSYENRYGWQF